jgi:hypothetical protein
MADARLPDSSNPDERLVHPKHFITTFWGIVSAVIAGVLLIVITAYWKLPSSSKPELSKVSRGDTGEPPAIRPQGDPRSQYRSPTIAADSARRVATPTAIDEGPYRPNAPSNGPLVLPSTAKGWLVEPLKTVASYACLDTLTGPGGAVRVRVNFNRGTSLDRLAPALLVRFFQGDTLFKTMTFEIQPRNLLSVTAPSKAGRYQIDVGVYSNPTLGAEYPHFLHAACPLMVV